MINEAKSIEDFIVILRDHEKRLKKLEDLLASKSQSQQKESTFRDIFDSKKPKNEIQKTLVICYCLENVNKMNWFNVKDIEAGYREIKEKFPKNINYNVIKNIEKDFLMVAKEKKNKLKAWNLTKIGERFVEQELGK